MTMKKWGRLAPPVNPMEQVARAFWQSRAGLREPPELTDLPALARALRTTQHGTASDTPNPKQGT